MARFHQLFAPALGIALATAACGGKQVEEAPEPVASTPAPAPAATPAPAPVATEQPAPETDHRRSTLEQRIHFDLDRADLSADARASLTAKAEILRSSPDLMLQIDGHADERGSDEYNLALSKRRAAEAKRFLMGQGIDAARLETVGFGEEQPLDPSSTESAWSVNRRDEFRVVGGALTQR